MVISYRSHRKPMDSPHRSLKSFQSPLIEWFSLRHKFSFSFTSKKFFWFTLWFVYTRFLCCLKLCGVISVHLGISRHLLDTDGLNIAVVREHSLYFSGVWNLLIFIPLFSIWFLLVKVCCPLKLNVFSLCVLCLVKLAKSGFQIFYMLRLFVYINQLLSEEC